jgi:uncharacterized protein (TIGR03083 family)
MESTQIIAGIEAQSEEMATDAFRNLDAQVEHCPEWKVRDLVEHIGRVQWFWCEIIERGVLDRAEMNDVAYPTDRGEPVAWFRSQTTRVVRALTSLADDAPLWTWWPPMQNAGFAKRRQLNEVVVHSWDARNAIGDPRPIPTNYAVVGLEEFVEVMAKDLNEGHTPPPVVLRTTDATWTSTLFAEDAPTQAELILEGTASDLLLTLWGRRNCGNEAITKALTAIDLS